MTNKIKLARYEEIIKQVINNALIQEVNNKYAKFASVLTVNLTNDLSYAKIYIDCLDRTQMDKVLENLNIIKGFLRTKVSHALDIYKTPQLIFYSDTTIDYVKKIDDLFAKINRKKENGKKE